MTGSPDKTFPMLCPVQLADKKFQQQNQLYLEFLIIELQQFIQSSTQTARLIRFTLKFNIKYSL